MNQLPWLFSVETSPHDFLPVSGAWLCPNHPVPIHFLVNCHISSLVYCTSFVLSVKASPLVIWVSSWISVRFYNLVLLLGRVVFNIYFPIAFCFNCLHFHFMLIVLLIYRFHLAVLSFLQSLLSSYIINFSIYLPLPSYSFHFLSSETLF